MAGMECVAAPTFTDPVASAIEPGYFNVCGDTVLLFTWDSTKVTFDSSTLTWDSAS